MFINVMSVYCLLNMRDKWETEEGGQGGAGVVVGLVFWREGTWNKRCDIGTVGLKGGRCVWVPGL